MITENRQEWLSGTLQAVAAALAGLAACAVAVQADDLARRHLAFAAVAGAFFLLVIWTRRVKEACLIGLAVSLTYNRAYFSFDAVLGDYGSRGLYWMVSDVFLAGLLLIWLSDAALQKRTPVPLGKPLWPILLPFVIACGLSAFAAASIPPVFFELWRVAKAALLFAWVRRYIRTEPDWWWCIGALAAAAALQCAWGSLQVFFGFKSFFRPQGEMATAMDEFKAVTDTRRASGTLIHPQIYCTYFLLLTPVFLGVVFGARMAWLRFVAGVFSLAGIASIAMTQSRVGWVVAALMVSVLFAGFVFLRIVRVQHALALAIFGVIGVAAALFPLRQKIIDRLTSDFAGNAEIRARYNRLALEATEKSPFIGVGLNNFEVDDPDIKASLEELELLRKPVALRVSAPVHNVYLLFLAETGIFGLGTFLLFVAASLGRGFAAVRQTAGLHRAACWGLTVGLLAVLTHQMTEFTFWVDPIFNTFVFILGLVTVAPAVLGRPESVVAHA